MWSCCVPTNLRKHLQAEKKLKSSQTQKMVTLQSRRLWIRSCLTYLPHTHLSDRWREQLVWAVDPNASVKVSKCVESEMMQMVQRVAATGGVDRSAYVEGDTWRIAETSVRKSGTTSKERWLLVALWGILALECYILSGLSCTSVSVFLPFLRPCHQSHAKVRQI